MKKFIRGYGFYIGERCEALTKHGPCQNYPLKNGSGRCKFHGGMSLKGEKSPRWKHGRYSKYR